MNSLLVIVAVLATGQADRPAEWRPAQYHEVPSGNPPPTSPGKDARAGYLYQWYANDIGELYYKRIGRTTAEAELNGIARVPDADSTYLLDRLPEAQPPDNWPRSVPFLRGMVRYNPARYTQSIFTLNSRPAIRAVPRTALLRKWQVPGGLENAQGWKSELYLLDGQYTYQWQERMPVVNQFGSTQYELGNRRSFYDGNLFADVLSKDGKVFELRVAEKQNGEWRRYVAYKDESARPAGYAGLKVSCASCHGGREGPGTGNYGAGLVPGGDSVISLPFKGLEY